MVGEFGLSDAISVHDNESGFTLIELLISLVVLSFGLLGLAGLQVQVVKANAFNRDMTIAAAIGTGLVEEAVAVARDVGIADQNFTNLFSGNDDPANPQAFDLSALANTGTIGNDPYSGRYRWNRMVDMRANFAIVDVEVRWPNRYDPSNDHQLRFRDVVQ